MDLSVVCCGGHDINKILNESFGKINLCMKPLLEWVLQENLEELCSMSG